VLESIDLNNIHSDGYAFQIEMTHLAFQKKFKVIEIPIVFKERESGISKISRNVVWEAFWLTLRLRAPITEITKTLALSYRKYLFLDE
jgi:dolichol-phosphate mannosyltransferase